MIDNYGMDGSPRPERGQVTRVLRLRPASRLGWLPDCLAFFAILVVARVARSDTTLSYLESASPGVTRLFQHDGLTWDALTPAPTIAGTIAWSVLRAGSGGDQRAVVSLTSSRQLVRQAWDGTSWGAAFTVTSDTGHYASRVFAAEHERSSGDHIVVYRRGANTSVYYRVFGSGSSAEQTFAMGLNSAPRWIELTPKPASDEMILLVATDTRLYGAVWDGSSFGNLQTLATSLPTTGRPFAAAYSSASGQAMVAWGVNSGSPQYRRWTGTAWDVTTSLSAGSNIRWLALAGNPRSTSNDIVAATVDTSRDLRGLLWNGTSWSASTVLETNVSAAAERRFDLAYQPDGAYAMIAWHAAGTTSLRYRTYSSGGLASGLLSTANLGSEPLSVHLSPGGAANSVSMGVRRRGAVSYGDYVMYSTGGNVTTGNATVNGLTGSGGAVSIPSAPAGSSNSNHVTVSNNATRNLSPGSYGYLAVGNGVTVNFTAGDYFIEYFNGSGANNTNLNFNTSAGDVRLILTNGSFQGQNNLAMTNSGGGRVGLYVKNGNFYMSNGLTAAGIELYVLNGNIDLGNNTNFSGGMFASGNVHVATGSVSLGHTIATQPDLLTALIFSDGLAGTPSPISSSITSISTCDAFSLAGTPSSSTLRITRWREISPDE